MTKLGFCMLRMTDFGIHVGQVCVCACVCESGVGGGGGVGGGV